MARVSSITSIDSSHAGAAAPRHVAAAHQSGAFEGRRSVVSTASSDTARANSESDEVDYFADPNQRTVRSFNKLETIG